MRGTIFGIVSLGVLIGLLPVMLDTGGGDSLGQQFTEVLSSFLGPLVVVLFLVACAALVVAFFVSDGY
jgi:hypothetical protein